jgi:serine/threonine-protein kinase
LEGQTIGKYKILSRVAEGGMGVFYQALDTRLDRTVGIKTLHTEFSVDAQLRERFINEAKALAKLNHPNICVLHDFFEDAERLFIVMEYIEGDTLSDIARSKGAISPEQAIPVFRQILLALDYAHRKNIIHRDIKPSNIMVSSQGIVKVMDFGIAKIVGSSKQLTMTGRKVGSIPYMSPEQITQKNIDHRSDLYSLGITLYQVLTGRVPFDSTSDFEVMKAHLEDPPPSPRSLDPRISKKVEEVILKSIAKKPEERYQTAIELRNALSNVGGTASRDAVPELVEEKTSVLTGQFDLGKGKKASRRGLIWSAVAALVIVVAGVLYVLQKQGGQEPAIREPVVQGEPAEVDSAVAPAEDDLPPPPPVQEEESEPDTPVVAVTPPADERETGDEEPSGPVKHRVRVQVDPGGVFRVDNYGWWQSSGRLQEGPHRIEAMAPGFPIYRDDFYVTGDTSFAIDLAAWSRHFAVGDLRASARTADQTFPDCEVYVNGYLEGEVPGFRKELRAGLYEIELRPGNAYRVDSLRYIGEVFRGPKARIQVPPSKRTFARFYLTKK